MIGRAVIAGRGVAVIPVFDVVHRNMQDLSLEFQALGAEIARPSAIEETERPPSTSARYRGEKSKNEEVKNQDYHDRVNNTANDDYTVRKIFL